MRVIKPISAALIVALLAGCAPLRPVETPPNLPTTSDKVRDQAVAQWTDPAVENDGRPSIVLYTPMLPPDEVLQKQVRIELESGATVKDVVAVLGNLGVSIVLADADAGDRELYLPRFKGTLGNLLAAVSRAADVWFTWNDGVIMVTGVERVVVSLPQDEGLADRAAAGLTDLGADDAAASWDAGLLVVTLRPSQLVRVRAFLDRITRNAAIVTMQVAIVTVRLDQDSKRGVDWNKMQVAIGSGSRSIFLPNNGSGPSTGTGGSGGTTVTTPQQLLGEAQQNTSSLINGALRAVIASQYFSLIALIDFLQTYGAVETRQNVVLRTVTGNEVELRSLVQIPYISSISATTTGGAVNTSANVVGSTKTDKANDGITVRLKPAYDAASTTVTVNFNLMLQAVLSFVQLQAGNQLGTLSQPITAERSFNDTLRLRPGETAVIGGLTYDQLQVDQAGPTGINPGTQAANAIMHNGLKVQRQTMFIVLRPTVKVMGDLEERESPPLFPLGKPPAPDAPVKAPPKGSSKAGKREPTRSSRAESEPAKPVKPAPPATVVVQTAPRAVPAPTPSVPQVPLREPPAALQAPLPAEAVGDYVELPLPRN